MPFLENTDILLWESVVNSIYFMHDKLTILNFIKYKNV